MSCKIIYLNRIDVSYPICLIFFVNPTLLETCMSNFFVHVATTIFLDIAYDCARLLASKFLHLHLPWYRY